MYIPSAESTFQMKIMLSAPAEARILCAVGCQVTKSERFSCIESLTTYFRKMLEFVNLTGEYLITKWLIESPVFDHPNFDTAVFRC